MKKFVTVLTATALLFSASVFAGDNNETKATSKVEKSFQKDFSKASNISWEKSHNVYIAHFDVNDVRIEAAYNEDGELVATSKEFKTTDLPLAVSLAISKKYPGYEVAKKGEEITYERETNYYINVGNDTEALKLKCSVNGDITVDKKIKK